jgi:YihY family inner membrane protein
MEAQDATQNAAQTPLSVSQSQNDVPATIPPPGESIQITGQVREKQDERFPQVQKQVVLDLKVQKTLDERVQVAAETHESQTLTSGTGQSLLTVEKQKIIKIEADAREILYASEKRASVKTAIEDAATFGEFWLKFLNDWSFNFASGLAYHLLMAMFPIVIATAAIVGFAAGELNQNAQRELIGYLGSIFPAVLGQNILTPALALLHRNAGILSIFALLLALYSGSRLFSSMEDCFALIYHTPTRSFWRQNGMALFLLLIFILLIPIMLLASSLGLRGFLGGLIASLILFQAIYMIVPNQKVSWRASWRGTLVAAATLQVYIAVFPLYIRHFLGSYTGNTGFAIILLLFFYYFALILLIGAEVNAFYANGVRAKPLSIATVVHQATLATDKAELLALAREREAKRRSLRS